MRTKFLKLVLSMTTLIVILSLFAFQPSNKFDIEALPTRSSTPTPLLPTQIPEPTVQTPELTSIKGAKLILDLTQSNYLSRDLNTVVQWVDGLGNWHDVDGWKSDANQGGYVEWWVGSENFGQGPFRWVGLNSSGEELLLSEEFYLPNKTGENIIVIAD